MSGPVQSVYKKYTVGSYGIWEKIRRFFAIDPNRSTGIPIIPIFRQPSPGTLDPLSYVDPVTAPAADLADNPYWKRDVRRQYPRFILHTQQDIAGLLEVGSKAAPRIADGSAGEKQLVEIKEGQGGKILVEVIKAKAKDVSLEILGENGLPPFPGKGISWVHNKDEGYPDQYPCRTYQ